ncbi:hypothetical protein BGW42_007628 [Actinomortierella wolfii]|nr:hypothetical protein BGW42_007628 [Actinomortierella wolfii]
MQPSINAEDDSNNECSRSRRWACTQLRTLKVRFARLPWRVRRSSDPPSPRTPTHAQQSRLSSAHSSKETIPSSPPTSPILQPQQQLACSSRHSTPSVCTATTTSSCSPELNRDLYHFLTPCTRLERLLIKEGLVLQQGREYDSLGALSNLEYLVWTTCYPVPIQEADMEWLQPKNAADCEIAKEPLMMPAPRLRKVIIRRSKLGDYKNEQAIVDWFQRHRPNIEFAFQLTHEWDDDAI